MKRDLQLNYGTLNHIIEQLHTYKNGLDTMHSSLSKINAFIENSDGKSIDAWDERIKESKKNIKSYQSQINDLLSLFENYVADTTTYIKPVARNVMMRVDRNDIWANLHQIQSGLTRNLPKALNRTDNTPYPSFSLEGPTEEEKEKSRSNKVKLERIRSEIEDSKHILDKKMIQLWDLYDSKIVKFENTDDEYNDKAAKIKDKYTNFFEGVWDEIESDFQKYWDLSYGLTVGVYEIVVGVLTLA